MQTIFLIFVKIAYIFFLNSQTMVIVDENGIKNKEKMMKKREKNISCDLAVEANEMATAKGNITEISGVSIKERNFNEYIHITEVEIKNSEGANSLGKEIGNYITIEMPMRFYGQQAIYEEMCRACGMELEKLYKNKIKLTDKSTILVVGLGNRNIIADALGPKVIDALMITRHLKEYIPEEIDESIRSVCGVAPGVLGMTGIETSEIIKGLVTKIKPDLIIAIDALCSHSVDRINTTIQFTDTGITPGAGIGNNRKALNGESLGVPVMAIGVPTVVDAATITGDSISQILERIKAEVKEDNPLYEMLSQLEREERYTFIKDTISPKFGNFIVAPKEVDTIIDDISRVIANGINIALHPGITFADVDKYK